MLANIGLEVSLFLFHKDPSIPATTERRLQHSKDIASVIPAVKSSLIAELHTALDIIKDESMRNIDIMV